MNKTSRSKVLGLSRGLLVVAVLVFAPIARAGGLTVALLPPTGENVAPQILSASRELIKDHLLHTGAYNVVEPPAGSEPPTAEPTAQQAVAIAQALGAAQALVVRITHLGTTARVRLTAYAVPSAQVAYWDSVAVTGGPEELDTVFQRLVHAMQTGKPVRDAAEIDTVTDKEMQRLGRRKANKVFGLHLLTLLPFNTVGSFEALPGGGLFWLYDARSWMADVALDVGFGAGGRGLASASIGGYYPFLREDFTPYLGLLTRWAYMDFGGDGGSGLSFQPTVGVLLGRLSTVQLRGDVGYFINTFSEYSTTTVVNTQQGAASFTDKHVSHGVAITVGLGF